MHLVLLSRSLSLTQPHHHSRCRLSLECVSFSKVLNIFSKFISPIKKTFLTEDDDVHRHCQAGSTVQESACVVFFSFFLCCFFFVLCFSFLLRSFAYNDSIERCNEVFFILYPTCVMTFWFSLPPSPPLSSSLTLISCEKFHCCRLSRARFALCRCVFGFGRHSLSHPERCCFI